MSILEKCIERYRQVFARQYEIHPMVRISEVREARSLASTQPVQTRDSDNNRRIDIIDSIRFVAAFWVAMSHGAFPLRDVTSSFLLRAFTATFDGVSAVIVFFIVSGFCIHFPYVGTGALPIIKFFLRRYIRIGIPLVACLSVMHMLGGNASRMGHAVLWSVYAEIVYYTIYPLLHWLIQRVGVGIIIKITSIISCALVFAHLDYLRPWEFGSLTWLWGLPIWLSGCALAENFQKGDLVEAWGNIWLWRLFAWLYGAAAIFAVNKLPVKIGYPVSMLPFTIFAFFWLSMELQSRSPSWRFFSALGSASYSLYLVHAMVLGAIHDHLTPLLSDVAAVVLPWPAIAVMTYIFYKIIESPSHVLARGVARNVSDFVSGLRRHGMRRR